MTAWTYEAYPEYADTGTDWLGLAPKHWRTIPVGRLFNRIKRTGHTDKELLSVYRDFGVIPKSSRNDNNNKPSEDLSPYQLVQVSDLVMNKMKTWQGSLAISEFEGIVSPAYFVYQPLEKLFEFTHPKYVHYLLRNPMYITQYLRRSKGIRVNQWDLDPDEFQRVELLLPSKVEQQIIFSFLDYETAKIDTLIEKQQQLIKLLKEKRQAVISHTVTKGLNPNVPMRYSGVEWLGNVPEHWAYVKLKHITKEIIDADHKTADYFEDGRYLVCRTTNVKNGQLHLEGGKYTNLETYKKWIKRGVPTEGDILFTREAPAGEACVYSGDVPLCLGQRMVLFKLKIDRVNPFFVLQSIYSGLADDFVKQLSQGSTVSHFNISDIQNIPLFEPPIQEQKVIHEYLEKVLTKYDGLTHSAVNMISLMQERRTALISAAVTGKIDVRNWQAPEPPINKTSEATA